MLVTKVRQLVEANCSIGPKECNVKMDKCGKCGSGSEAFDSCVISWTLYDYDDVQWWMPWRYAGSPFHIYGYWQGTASGTVRRCENE